MGRKSLNAALDHLRNIPATESRVLIATGLIGEGFDDSRLDTLFLTMPVSWRGTIAQYAGRLHRLHDSKKVVRVHDYADLDVPMLARMFDKRCVGYEAIGYSILLPASALPGWPVVVPLPVDPLEAGLRGKREAAHPRWRGSTSRPTFRSHRRTVRR